MDWVVFFKSGKMKSLKGKFSTLSDLANAIETGTSVDALFSAHRRHQSSLELEPLANYLKPPEETEKQPKLSVDDFDFRLAKETKKHVSTAKRFVVTSATNNCPVDRRVWQSLKKYAEHNKAAILVIPVRYRNPTSLQESENESTEDVWWAEEVLPYLTDEQIKLGRKILVMSNVRIQATAVHPLNGLDALSGDCSAIFGHSQLAMKTVPVPGKQIPKILYTTGSTTVAKYSKTKSGVKGRFHHGLGACVAEVDGASFHLRAVVADKDGGFYDLDTYYSPEGVKEGEKALALVLGDEHAIFNDPGCREATFGKKGICDTIKPDKLITHDVFDGYSVSHHGRKDPLLRISKYKTGRNLLKRELEETLTYLEETTPEGAERLVVSSNHHDHLLRWLKEVNAPLEEPWNAEIWLELWTAVVASLKASPTGADHIQPFAAWVGQNKKESSQIAFLPSGSEYRVKDVSVGYHGHEGVNGSRGSLAQFARIGAKTVIGHSHSPGILHGGYQVGTSSYLTLEYNKGPSSRAHCHCVIYPNGKRQLIFVINGKWRA